MLSHSKLEFSMQIDMQMEEQMVKERLNLSVFP